MGMTQYHNEVRAQVQTTPTLPPLTWSASLAATAAAWGAQCRDIAAPSGMIDHNPNRSNGYPYYVGENIYASGGTATAQAAVNIWGRREGQLRLHEQHVQRRVRPLHPARVARHA